MLLEVKVGDFVEYGGSIFLITDTKVERQGDGTWQINVSLIDPESKERYVFYHLLTSLEIFGRDKIRDRYDLVRSATRAELHWCSVFENIGLSIGEQINIKK